MWTIAHAASAEPDPIIGAMLWFYLLMAYFLPIFIAFGRGHHNRAAISALTVLAGWTVLGWLVAFVWSLTRVSREENLAK